MSNDNEAGATNAVASVIQSAADRIRQDLQQVRPVEAGTVMRWVSVGGDGSQWNYAAIFTGGHWFLTTLGNRHFQPRYVHEDLMARLMSEAHRIVDLEVAETFTKIEL